MRFFYGFVAQVVRLDDTELEKLYSYSASARLSRLLPNREAPPDIEIADDMLRLHAVKIVQKEKGSASLPPGVSEPLRPIYEFGAKPHTDDEKRALSEIIKAFNVRHSTKFTAEDFLRFDQVNREILDADITERLRTNPTNVVYTAFSQAFFQGAIRIFQRNTDMTTIVLPDAEAREQAIRHFLNRALREVREAERPGP